MVHLKQAIKAKEKPVILTGFMELMTRIELVNLILTKDALYRLSYISMRIATHVLYYNSCGKKSIGFCGRITVNSF